MIFALLEQEKPQKKPLLVEKKKTETNNSIHNYRKKKKWVYPLLVSINSLEKKMVNFIKEFRIQQVKDPQYIILDNADFIQMFKISTRTAQNWRK